MERWESAFGRYLYASRFRGRSPVLDIGPGRCWFTRQDPENVIGLDIEPSLVDHYSRTGLNIVLGSVDEMPFDDGAFEAVFCCWLFEHLWEPEKAISEIARVLAPGGYACLIVPSQKSLLKGFYDDYTHVRPFTRPSLAQLAKQGNFSSFRVEHLFWTRGGGRLFTRLGERALYSYLRFSDRIARRLHVVNRNNLVLEVWK